MKAVSNAFLSISMRVWKQDLFELIQWPVTYEIGDKKARLFPMLVQLIRLGRFIHVFDCIVYMQFWECTIFSCSILTMISKFVDGFILIISNNWLNNLIWLNIAMIHYQWIFILYVETHQWIVKWFFYNSRLIWIVKLK